jgi:IPT/TIG domain/Regulator of chromosome condensation (RCC1) repeat
MVAGDSVPPGSLEQQGRGRGAGVIRRIRILGLCIVAALAMSAAAAATASAGPPTVTSINPASGSTLGGTPVLIKGSGFVVGATVTIGGEATGVFVVSETEITAKTAASAVGPEEVVVSDVNGTSTGGPSYTYVPPAPTVTSISPTSGSTLGGTAVTIKGSGFLTGSTVTIGSTATSVAVVSETEITATTAATTAGPDEVVVADTSGTSTAGPSYTYVPYGITAWGHNASGQLGNASTTNSDVPVEVSGLPLSGIGGVSAGGEHSLAVLGNEAVMSWGNNASGQLGNASTTNSDVPVEVSALSGVAAIAAGGGHSLARLGTGKVKAWGHNASGQLGNGSTTNSDVPVEVSALSGVAAVAAGGEHSLALIGGGQVMAWGSDQFGQLGNHNTGGLSAAPTTVLTVTGPPLSGAVAIAAGGEHSLALLSTAKVVAWGENADGQLGNSSLVSSNVPVEVVGVNGVLAIAAGGHHSLALLNTGKVMAWGENADGQLGNGSLANSDVPVEVSGLSGVAAIAAGGNHSLALLKTGKVKAWGDNASGQLGNGATTNSDVPVEVRGLTGVTAIAAGGEHSLAYAPKPPTVTSINPTSGSTVGGTPVLIKGSGFLAGATVKIGKAATSVHVVSETEITAKTAASAAGSHEVVVTDANGTSTADPSYTYVTPPPPTVTSINPTSGTTSGGTAVTIKGSGFLAGATVTIGSTATSVAVVSETELTAKTAATAAGANEVVVTDANGKSTGGPFYTYVTPPPPTVTSVSPNSGSVKGGTPVLIKGSGFLAGATVSIGYLATSVDVISETEITATTAATPASYDEVAVTDANGTSTGGPLYLYIAPQPVITSISPASGAVAGGTPVTIKGSGFLTGATVAIGSAATSVHVVSETEITATTATTAAGPEEVVVTDEGGSSTGGPSYTYFNPPPPTVTSINPTSGSTLGGTAVLVKGTGFLSGATVTIGSAATSVSVLSETEITATTATTAAGSDEVVVGDANGTSAGGPSYTYVTPPPPTVTTISPTSGTTLGGTAVTIKGSTLLPGATVTIGSAATSVSVVSETEITATTAATAAGSDQVVVTDANGTSTGGPSYTYVAPAPPEWGRCKKVTIGTGRYEGSGCTSLGGKKGYEWFPWGAGLPAPKYRFTTKLAAGTLLVMETITKTKVECTGATSEGEYTGPKTVGSVAATLTGCKASGFACQTEGANAGEVVTRGLEGVIGWENKSLRKVAEDLFPVGGTGPFVEFSCGGAQVTVAGSILDNIKAGSMLLAATVKYSAKSGKQKPEKFEGEPRDVLEASILGGPFEQIGQTSTATQTNEEKIEANWFV